MAAPTRRRLWAGPVLRMTTVRKKFKGAFAELHSNSLGVYHSATPDRTAVPETVIVLDQASTAKAAHADPPDDQPKNLAVEVAGRTAKVSECREVGGWLPGVCNTLLGRFVQPARQARRRLVLLQQRDRPALHPNFPALLAGRVQTTR